MFPSYIYFSIHLCGPNHFYVYSHFSFSWTRCLAISVRSEGTVKSKCEWKTQQIHLGKENKRRLPKAAFNHVWTWSAVAARCFRGSRVRSGFARRHGILTGPWAWTLNLHQVRQCDSAQNQSGSYLTFIRIREYAHQKNSLCLIALEQRKICAWRLMQMSHNSCDGKSDGHFLLWVWLCNVRPVFSIYAAL